MSKFIIEPSDKSQTKSDKGMFKNVVLTISVIGVISVGFILFKDTFIKISQETTAKNTQPQQIEKLKQTRKCIGCNLQGADLTGLTTFKKLKEINCNDYHQRATYAKACSSAILIMNLARKKSMMLLNGFRK